MWLWKCRSPCGVHLLSEQQASRQRHADKGIGGLRLWKLTHHLSFSWQNSHGEACVFLGRGVEVECWRQFFANPNLTIPSTGLWLQLGGENLYGPQKLWGAAPLLHWWWWLAVGGSQRCLSAHTHTHWYNVEARCVPILERETIPEHVPVPFCNKAPNSCILFLPAASAAWGDTKPS